MARLLTETMCLTMCLTTCLGTSPVDKHTLSQGYRKRAGRPYARSPIQAIIRSFVAQALRYNAHLGSPP